MKSKGTTIWIPQDLIKQIDQFKRDRNEPNRSSAFRFLVLRGLASMSYLSYAEKKALGINKEK